MLRPFRSRSLRRRRGARPERPARQPISAQGPGLARPIAPGGGPLEGGGRSTRARCAGGSAASGVERGVSWSLWVQRCGGRTRSRRRGRTRGRRAGLEAAGAKRRGGLKGDGAGPLWGRARASAPRIPACDGLREAGRRGSGEQRRGLGLRCSL